MKSAPLRGVARLETRSATRNVREVNERVNKEDTDSTGYDMSIWPARRDLCAPRGVAPLRKKRAAMDEWAKDIEGHRQGRQESPRPQD